MTTRICAAALCLVLAGCDLWWQVRCPTGSSPMTKDLGEWTNKWCEKVGPRGEVYKEGPFVSTYPNGSKRRKGSYSQDHPQGVWRTWHRNGQISGEVDHSKPDAPTRFWFSNGQLRVDGQRAKRKRHGLWKQYYRNGQKEYEETWVNGVLEGAFRSWREDGTPDQEGSYKNGKESGTWVNYHPNGRVSTKGQAADGLRAGEWQYWLEDGSVRPMPEEAKGFERVTPLLGGVRRSRIMSNTFTKVRDDP